MVIDIQEGVCLHENRNIEYIRQTKVGHSSHIQQGFVVIISSKFSPFVSILYSKFLPPTAETKTIPRKTKTETQFRIHSQINEVGKFHNISLVESSNSQIFYF